ncbi:MAG TPA: gamma-glutamyl-gamma-aminobutyrate hydrolase family protein, partial [Xanthomonadales bacterium]|nr:gamma-glutamyl-gamma-aminobutyrate hydrolase family protein [Xanthomonadales bacterium]
VHAEAYDAHGHELRMEAGSWFSQLHGGATTGRVNSLHHQGVKKLGTGLEAAAWSDDGVIEAIRGTGESFIAGVQWHPEFHDGRDPALLNADPLMRAFLDAAALRKSKG